MKPVSHIIILTLAILTSMASAWAQSPREQLSQMVEQLQKTPTDNALREKIIKQAGEIKPSPTIPPEARRAFVMGNTFQTGAKSVEDFGLAVKAFQDATAAAPWWGDAYYNLSVALESAGRFDEAKAGLTFYLMTQPKDAAQAQERLYAIDAKKVLAGAQQAAEARTQREAENSPQAKARKDEELIKSLNGALFVDRSGFGFEGQYLIVGKQLRLQQKRVQSNVCDCGGCSGSIGAISICSVLSLNGREAIFPANPQEKRGGMRITIAPDGNSITEVSVNWYNGKDSFTNIFNRY